MPFAATIRQRSLRKPYAGLRPAVRDEAGATLVETAFSLVVLLTLLFGIMQFGLVLYSYHFISEAAREGTRYAIVRGASYTTDCTAPTAAICTAQGGNNTGDIATYVQNLGFPGIDPGKMTVNSTWFTNTGAACGTSDLCKQPGNSVQVTVQYAFPFAIPFIPANTLNMSSSSMMVISN